MFLQIHYLTSYHATLLNRDDAGLAKQIVFGGVTRLRVSSQSQKRHWRQALTARTDLPSGMRSRHFFSREVRRRLVEERGMNPDMAHALTLFAGNRLLRASGEKESLDPKSLELKQAVLFGRPEANFLVQTIAAAADAGDQRQAESSLEATFGTQKANFKALMAQAGIGDPSAGFEGALFGRFVTSDVLSRVDAPVHVAHAFTTHEMASEVDYFTAVDDLAAPSETGFAHGNDMPLGAGIFYGYVVVDIPLLVSNLTGCARTDWQAQDLGPARALLTSLIDVIAQVSPGAKLGATAPYARADLLVLESGRAQPRSLANAYIRPVRLGVEESHPVEQSVAALARYLGEVEAMYGAGEERRHVASVHPWPGAETREPLAAAISATLNDVFGADR